jgi:hypothetical protein
MRSLNIKCDSCGKPRPSHERPQTWWLLEQESAVLTTGPLDFCSLGCLARWLADPAVRTNPAYPHDFIEVAPHGL